MVLPWLLALSANLAGQRTGLKDSKSAAQDTFRFPKAICPRVTPKRYKEELSGRTAALLQSPDRGSYPLSTVARIFVMS